MKLGSLSEEEIEKIGQILEQEGIRFEVGQDTEVIHSNDLSMQNNLRHYHPPNISTHILAISIDSEFQRLSEAAKAKLMTFGITDQLPSPNDFDSSTSTSHKKHEPFKFFHFVFKYMGLALVLFFLLLLLRFLTM